MPRLQKIETEEMTTPTALEQLQAINEDKHKDLENSLLKEALAISNDKCNSLISEQNTLVAGLTSQVNSVRKNNALQKIELEEKIDSSVQEFRKITESERTFKAQVSREITEAIRETAGKIITHAKNEMGRSTEEVKRELAESAKEIRKQREDMKEQSLLRKIFFWATPAFLLIQTVLLAFALFA